MRGLGVFRAFQPREQVQEFGNKELHEITKELASNFTNNLYYPAKNWSYLQETYFIELERIQRRIDWARSSFIIVSSVLLIQFFWLAFIWLTFIAAFTIYYKFPKWETYPKIKSYTIRVSKRTAILILLAFIGCYISKTAYETSEEQFNERAFGYFLSELDRRPSKELADERSKWGPVVWMQTSAEYRAICLQTFNWALQTVDNGIKNRTGINKAAAVVLDLDETVLDNTDNSTLFPN